MMPFEEYLRRGIVTRSNKDTQRAEYLMIEAERKLSSLQEKIDKIGVRDDNANDYVEHCYDILMFLLRAKLFREGYSCSGLGAHEAEVSFMANLGFSDTDIRVVDSLRYFRNGILYYGKRFDKEYAEKTITFTTKAHRRLRAVLG